MRIRTLGLAFAGLLAGCTTFHGARPIHPGVGEVVDTLQPTLRWEPAAETYVTYDLVIARGKSNETFRKDTEGSYYREALKEPEHRIEQPLMPSQRYYWAVRIRQGDQVTGWSNYDHWVFWGLGKTTTYGLHNYFVTPATTAPGPAKTD